MKRQILACALALALTLLAPGCAGQYTQTAPPAAETVLPAGTTVPGSTEPDSETASSAVPTGEDATVVQTTAMPEQTGAETTEPQTTEWSGVMTENEAFLDLAGDCDGAILGVICNEPFADGDPAPTVVWNEGDFGRLVICPRWVGSHVSVWKLSYGEDGREVRYLEGPIYEADCAQGDSFGAALDRPEGDAAWAVAVRAPDGAEAWLELSYNGRYGTLAREYLTDDSLDALGSDEDESEIIGLMDAEFGAQTVHAYVRAALRDGRNPFETAWRCCMPLFFFGDGAAWIVCQGEMDGAVYTMQAGLLRESYDPGWEYSLAERLVHQAALYDEIGNEWGILGPDREPDGPLYVNLTGLSIFNPTLLAQTVSVTVNGADAGSFELTRGDLCTLVDLDVPNLPADVPVKVEVRVTGSRGAPEAAILEVMCGLSGNISGAR